MRSHRLALAAVTLVSLAAAACTPNYQSSVPLADVNAETLCFFDGSACALAGRTRSLALVLKDDRSLWLDVAPLAGIFPGDELVYLAEKRAEDDSIYLSDDETKATVDECCDGDTIEWQNTIADDLGYTDSAWQYLTLVGAYLRTGRVVSPRQWLSLGPLIGTAGNGPEILFPGTPLIGGDVENTYLSRIAIGHDTDWGLGRILGRGPLAKYLHAERFGGGAPDEYDVTMGLAGLGAVTCDPTSAGAPCDWYEYAPTATGGEYTSLGGHPDWTVAVIPYSGEPDTPRTVCRDGDISPCICATPRPSGWGLAPGRCR